MGPTSGSSRAKDVERLRAATYLCPSIPVEYFEALLQYIEGKLGWFTSLRYESRWDGPSNRRPDPFQENEIDLGWVSSTSYLRMKKEKTSFELLPVSSVHIHPNAEDKPGHFSDVIIHNKIEETIKDFTDLRGCRWAYNGPQSLSGHVVTLHNLKLMGENSTFFGNALHSESHLESIRMVLNRKVDAAAVDANCLALFRKNNPRDGDNLSVVTSWGPLTPYPLLVRKELSPEMKQQLVDSLLHMDKDGEGRKVLASFNLRRFTPVSSVDFETENDFNQNIEGMRFDAIYY